MKMNAQTENTKTLAAALGVDEAEAEELLSISILITTGKDDQVAKTFSEELKRLLERTVTTVQLDGFEATPTDVEIVVGKCTPRTDATLMYVNLRGSAAVISMHNEMQSCEDSTIVHPVFLLLTACYTAAKTLSCALGPLFPYRVEDPLVLDFNAIFTEDLDALKEPTDIQTTYLAGAGAVGNAYIYALRYFDVSGTVYIVDPKETKAGVSAGANAQLFAAGWL